MNKSELIQQVAQEAGTTNRDAEAVLVEVLKDITFRLAPVSRDEALSMLDGIQAAEMLKGVRGSEPVDREALGWVYIVVGPGERVDGDTYPWGWSEAAYDDAAWLQAAVVRNAVQQWGPNYGIYTGWRLVPRRIPPMEERLERLPAIRRAEGVPADEGFLRGEADLIVVAIPLSAEHRLLQSLKKLWPVPVDIRIARQPSDLKLSPRAYGYLGKLPLLSVFDRPLKGRRRAKDLLDRALAALLGLVLLPVALLGALAVRLEGGGPVLVRERRYGFDGTEIAVYRFRSGTPPTPVGRVLRKLRLDGLPQLVNVLKGDLSLVGPRLRSDSPEEAGLYSQVIDGYFARHRIKPGLTGWAQINGWADAMEKTSKHDLEYVDRWSLLFDLYILFKAPFALLRRRAAA